MVKIFMQAFKIKSYCLLVLIYSCIEGCFASFGGIISLLFDFYNPTDGPPVYTSSVVALYGGLTSIVGILSSMLCGIFLQKTHKYLITTRIICIMMSLMIGLAAFTIPSG